MIIISYVLPQTVFSSTFLVKLTEISNYISLIPNIGLDVPVFPVHVIVS